MLKDSRDGNEIEPALLFKERYGVEISGNVDAKHDVQGELTGKVNYSISRSNDKSSRSALHNRMCSMRRFLYGH